MTNEINGLYRHRSLEPVDAKGTKGAATSRTPEQDVKPMAPNAADSVSLTDTAARLQHLESVLAKQPVVDKQRVEDLRQALADGSYQDNPERVADKLMELERILDARFKK